MARRPTPKQTLDALIELFVPDIRSAFIASIRDVTDNVVIKAMIANIQSGDVEAAFRTLGFTDAAMRPLTASIERAYEQGGVATGKTFPKVLNTPNGGQAVFRFDVRNSRAERYLREHSSNLVTRLTNEARVTLRNTLEIGVREGRNPRNIALDIVGRVGPSGERTGGIIGLTEQQEFWVRSARTKLVQLDDRYFDMSLRDKRFDSTVRKAIESGKALPTETVDRLVSRYKDKALKYRGDTIARTEAMQALNSSEYEAVRQAVDMGSADASAVRREWDSAGDSRVRWSHKRMDGQQVGLDEPFVSPSGARMLHPGDTSLGAGADEVVACRCRARTVIDWLADID